MTHPHIRWEGLDEVSTHSRDGAPSPEESPGSAGSTEPRTGHAEDGEPTDGGHPSGPDGAGTRVPRLTQFSSLGSRGNAGRGPAAPRLGGSRPGGRPGPNGFGDGSAQSGGTDDSRSPGSVIPLFRARKRPGDSARRAGSRGALTVVGVVGLLAAGGVLLTLGLINRDHGSKAGAGSVTVAPDGRRGDVLDALTAPSVTPDGGTPSTRPDGSKEPAPSASSTSGGPSADASSPGPHTSPSAKTTAKAGATTQHKVPGVGVFSHASHRCIDVVGGKAVPGAGLMISDCSQSAAQHWTFTSGTMRTLGMCVQLRGGSTDDGTDLVLASCDGDAAQRFVLNSSHDLVSGLADKCADVRDNQTASGTRLQLWSCSGADNQKWSTL